MNWNKKGSPNKPGVYRVLFEYADEPHHREGRAKWDGQLWLVHDGRLVADGDGDPPYPLRLSGSGSLTSQGDGDPAFPLKLVGFE